MTNGSIDNLTAPIPETMPATTPIVEWKLEGVDLVFRGAKRHGAPWLDADSMALLRDMLCEDHERYGVQTDTLFNVGDVFIYVNSGCCDDETPLDDLVCPTITVDGETFWNPDPWGSWVVWSEADVDTYLDTYPREAC